MARTGYKITVYLDDNPNSETYLQTYEERTEDLEKCPINEDDLILVGNECEIVESGYTGYRVLIYYNRTTGEYSEVKELDPECEATSDEEQWVASGDPFCETTEQGINTGYMLQLLVQRNAMLPNYGATKYNRYKSPECGENNCPIWNDLEKSCHIAVNDCVATFDGTADIMQIDINPLSPTYNQTRTANKQDSDCENCTNTLFDWVWVGEMCGDDDLLCSNGVQQVSTNSYIVYRKYKTIGSGSPIPMDEYQVTLNEEDDEDCGFIRPQYKWEKQPGYLCDYETYTKYELYAKMVSYDEGVTWSIKQPYETQRGEIIAYDSYDCGKPMYRWVTTNEFLCEDNGDDGKIRYYSTFTNGEFDGLVSTVPCNESSILSWNEITSVTSASCAVIGDCVSDISGNTNSLTSTHLKIGDYVENIWLESFKSIQTKSLDVPERVKIFSPFDSTVSTGVDAMIMHCPPPAKAPSQYVNLDSIIPGQWYGYTGDTQYLGTLFVKDEEYDNYMNDEMWSQILTLGNFGNRILPMNRDNIDYKAILTYKSDFSEFRWFMPDEGEYMGYNGSSSGQPSTGISDTIGSYEGLAAPMILKKIEVLGKVKTINRCAFTRRTSYQVPTQLEEIELDEGVENINSSGFCFSAAHSIKLPSTLKTIGQNAFSYHAATSIHIPSGVTYVSSSAFTPTVYENNRDVKITSITIDNGVKSIGVDAFKQCWAEHLVIPDSVETVSQGSFSEYRSGQHVAVPRSGNTKTLVIGKKCDYIGVFAFAMHPTDAQYIKLRRSGQIALAANGQYGNLCFGDIPCKMYVPVVDNGYKFQVNPAQSNHSWWYYFNDGRILPYGGDVEITSVDLNGQWSSSTTYYNFSGYSEYYQFYKSTDIGAYSGDVSMSYTLTGTSESGQSLCVYVLIDEQYDNTVTSITIERFYGQWHSTRTFNRSVFGNDRKWYPLYFDDAYGSNDHIYPATTTVTCHYGGGYRGTVSVAIPIVQPDPETNNNNS